MEDKILNVIVKYLAGEASPEQVKQAEDWIARFPDEFEKIKEAYGLNVFATMNFDAEQQKEKVFSEIGMEVENSYHRKVRNINYFGLKIAASLLLFLSIAAAIIVYNNINSYYIIANNTNGLKEVTLPDGSVVTLDKHSSVAYSNDWLNRFRRKVKMTGRAYFVIVKNPDNPFMIKINDVTVTVLGTKFTVSENGHGVQVVLNEGKVKVTSGTNNSSYFLTYTGEQIIIDNGNIVKQNRVNKNLYFSWLKEKLHFKNCSVEEATEFLSDSYGIKVSISDSTIMQKQLYGSAPSDDPLLIIRAIAYITNKEIVKENGIINLK